MKTCSGTREFFVHLLLFCSMFLKNLNWNFVGLQASITIVCMKIADVVLLHHTFKEQILAICQILFAVVILLRLKKFTRESFGSLEIFIGSGLGMFLINQQFKLLAIVVALVAIWLLEQNESKSETLTGKQYLWTTLLLLVFTILTWCAFGISSITWIITMLIGWIFQMACMTHHSRVWKTNTDIWYPIQICSPKLWIANLMLANLGIIGVSLIGSSVNLALALVLGQFLRQDKIGRWFSITRLIAFTLVVLPELLQSTLQTLQQYY